MAIDLLSQMPVEDFLKKVFEQKKMHVKQLARIDDLTDRLTDAIDLVCVFQKKAEILAEDKKILIKKNFKLNDQIKELQEESGTDEDTEDTIERLEHRYEENRRFENIKKDLQEKLGKIRRMGAELCRLRIKVRELQKENEILKKKTPFIFKAPPLLNYVPNKNEKWPIPPPPPPYPPPPHNTPSAP